MKHAVMVASFDPITSGHIWVVDQGAQLFDKLTIGVGINASKKYVFSLEEKMMALQTCFSDYPNVKIEYIGKQMLVDFARKVGATYNLRGIRNPTDYEYERVMRNINGDLDRKLTTVSLMPPRELAEVSSSIVNSFASTGFIGWEMRIIDYVPPVVVHQYIKKYINSDTDQVERLKTRWTLLMKRLDCGTHLSAFYNLVKLYQSPNRAYHNLWHIEDCLGTLDQLIINEPQAVQLELAIWFHDAVYEMDSGAENEDRSAELVSNFIGELKSVKYDLSLVPAIITKATKHPMMCYHTLEGDEKTLVGYLHDLDLQGLANSEKFLLSDSRIRAEYAHVPNNVFWTKRREFFEKLLEGPIFVTKTFAECEMIARDNIKEAVPVWNERAQPTLP